MNWKFHFAITAAACAVLPFVVPAHSLTILVEALIFGLFAMSLDLWWAIAGCIRSDTPPPTGSAPIPTR